MQIDQSDGIEGGGGWWSIVLTIASLIFDLSKRNAFRSFINEKVCDDSVILLSLNTTKKRDQIMSGERIPLTDPTSAENGFYTGEETSTGAVGATGASRRILHILTVISVLVAIGTSIYGFFEADTPLIMLPLVVVIIWLFIHIFLIVFARHETHEFHPPGWFIFVSSGNIFIQALIVIILTLFKRPT